MSDYDEMMEVVGELTEAREVSVDKSSRTGVPSLDVCLGGSLPAGATEIFGPPGTGKSSLIYEILATAQADGFLTALCATEYLDTPRMDCIGCKRDEMLVIKGTGEAVLEGAKDFLRRCRLDSTRCLLVIDSGTGLRPDVEQYDDATVMLEMFLAAALGILPAGSGIVIANQVRQKRSLESGRKYVDDTDSTSRRLAEMFSARLSLSRLLVTEETYSLMVDVVANENGPPLSILSVPFIKKYGIDTMLDLVRCGVAAGALHKSGEWYHLMEGAVRVEGLVYSLNLGHGEKEVAKSLARNAGVARWVLDVVMGLTKVPEPLE